MNHAITLLEIPLLTAVFQGIIYTYLFIRRGYREERYSDYWQASLILSIAVFLLTQALMYLRSDTRFTLLLIVLGTTMTTVGPLMFFYLKSQLNTNFRFGKKDLWHFAPFFFFEICLIYRHFNPWFKETTFYTGIFYSLTIYRSIALVVYWVLCWRMYQKYKHWLPTERSDTEGVRFEWYQNFLVVFAISITLTVLYDFVYSFYPFPESYLWYQRVLAAFTLYYICVAGYAQNQPNRLIYEEKQENLPQNTTETGLANGSKLAETDMNNWKNKIMQAMDNDKLYLNSELTLSDIAQKIGINTSIASSVINTAFGKNFNDFVNEYRVNLFTEKINNPQFQHLSLLGIAFECGFNSKATFNRAVKKITNRVPSDFIVKN
jgi:AraC-like DNA-binding protein